MIALLDYGSGNLRSVHKSLLKVGAEVRLVRKPEEIGGAQGMVLPGVGAFDDCIQALRQQELLGAAREFIQSGKPFLGICVGYQALFEKSEEFNSCAAGLGVFRGKVVRFKEKTGSKLRSRIARFIEESRTAVTSTLSTVFIRNRTTRRLSPRVRNMEIISRHLSGAKTYLPPSFIRRKASAWACNY